MEIKALGPGGDNTVRLMDMTVRAAQEMNLNADCRMVTGVAEIIRVSLSTPALTVGGRLVHAGRPLPELGPLKDT